MTCSNYATDVLNFANSDGPVLELLLTYKTTLEKLDECQPSSQGQWRDLDSVIKSLSLASAACQSDLCNVGYIVAK